MNWNWFSKDTPESLNKEVFGFFTKFAKLQKRINALITANEQAYMEETNAHLKKVETLQTEFDRKLKAEDTKHMTEIKTLKNGRDMLDKGLKLADKVVSFATETN